MDLQQAAAIDGVEPEPGSIHRGDDPLSRTLYVYAKVGHVKRIPGLLALLEEFTSERAIGEEGDLIERGLIPLSENERRVSAERVNDL